MFRALWSGLFVFPILFAASVSAFDFHRCNCDGEEYWSTESILQWQKVSDLLIAIAYFSIPLELLCFATFSHLLPFKWIILQFGAFIVLCGLTHLLNVFTYEPHPFLYMLALTVSKFFTALVSFATALTLVTLIPQLLRVKVREDLLRLKASELDREVGMMKRQEEASWHVRMLTQEIRKSLDRHTILYTTLVELSKTLALQNCVVWMPNEAKSEMNLTHELRRRSPSDDYMISIPTSDPDVAEIRKTEGVKIIRPDSVLGSASSGLLETGAVAAIRIQILKVADFKGGTPEVIQACYAILVLVLPKDDSRHWSYHELEIVEVVADQVAVALSHAAILEDSQLMRDKLEEKNRALLHARKDAVMASEARNSFERVMSRGMRTPIHSVLGLLSMLQQKNLRPEQKLIVDAMAKTSNVVSALINDVMEISAVNRHRFTLEMKPFGLHCMIKEVASVARCLCDCRGFGFGIQIENVVSDRVIGDEKWIFHVILHSVSNLLNGGNEGYLKFRVQSVDEMEQRRRWPPWESNYAVGYCCVKFEIGFVRSQSSDLGTSDQLPRGPDSEGFDMGLGFSMCRKLVQLMHGDIWAVPNSQGVVESMTLILRFQPQLTSE